MAASKEQIERAQWWVKVWASHLSELKTPVALKFAEATMTMTEANLELAWTEWMRAERKAPMPADLLGDEKKAKQVAANIWQALSWRSWPTRKDNGGFSMPDETLVYDHIGPISTAVVLKHGGFHAMLKKFNAGEFDEHWSNVNWSGEAKSVMEDVRAGREVLSLPEPNASAQLAGVIRMVKRMPEKGGPRDPREPEGAP